MTPGTTFTPRNAGVEVVLPDDDPDIGCCVHALMADPADPDTIWRQEGPHGVYRTTDGGDSWEHIERGLPARFGFPIVRDDASGALFVFPLQADESRIPVDGRFAAWRSLDGGDSWSRSGKGWPEQPTYSGVLRARQRRTATAACTSAAPAAGCGQPPDAGNTWEALRGCYPRILALAIW